LAKERNKKALTSFLESETVELKLDYTESIRKDIIAFANTSGGIIYIGIADDGTVVGVSSADQMIQRVANTETDGAEWCADQDR
jgi:ATP-dependent DNA helicase RecG